MRVIDSCDKCLYDKRVFIAQSIADETKRAEYLKEIRAILDNRDPEDSAPYLVSLFEQVQKKYDIPEKFYPKEQYNSIIMDVESQIEAEIEAAADPLEMAIVFARIGNYIDFGAMNTVDPDILMKMIKEDHGVGLDADVYAQFIADCEKGHTFVLLCDNCGEIVLDKLLIRQMKKRFPHLQMKVMVRGEAVLNDATMEDAVFCGMDKEAEVITNGNAVAGTVWKLLSEEAKTALEQADVILSKGQGNFETFFDYKGVVYYTFLCKCELFTTRFQVPRLTGMFVRMEQE